MIRTRRFGRAGCEIPEIGLGCYNLTADRGADRDTALATLTHAYELGVRFFDTAPMYGDGECDELLGLAFGHLDADEVMIGAKMSGPPGEHLEDFSRDSVLRVFERTLRALRRDTVFAHRSTAPARRATSPARGRSGTRCTSPGWRSRR